MDSCHPSKQPRVPRSNHGRDKRQSCSRRTIAGHFAHTLRAGRLNPAACVLCHTRECEKHSHIASNTRGYAVGYVPISRSISHPSSGLLIPRDNQRVTEKSSPKRYNGRQREQNSRFLQRPKPEETIQMCALPISCSRITDSGFDTEKGKEQTISA